MAKPRIEWSAKEGMYEWPDGGSFEVFWNDGDLEGESLDDPPAIGWYWWPCFPGCLPDGEACGPFNSSTAAWKNARYG